jgi:hypothetical protein
MYRPARCKVAINKIRAGKYFLHQRKEYIMISVKSLRAFDINVADDGFSVALHLASGNLTIFGTAPTATVIDKPYRPGHGWKADV